MIARAILQQRVALRPFYTYFLRRTSLPLAKFPLRSHPIVSKVNLKWYSTEPEILEEQKIEKSEERNEEKDNAAPNPQEKDLFQREFEAKNKEILELKDRYLRSVADFRNLQERTKRDIQAARNFAIQKFAIDLIETVDNFERALSIVPKEKLRNPNASEDWKDFISLYEGLKMTEEVMMNTLKKNGLERFDPSSEGAKFNPSEHEATFMIPVEGKENNTVFSTQQKGFKLHGRVLRAAKVGVVKNP